MEPNRQFTRGGHTRNTPDDGCLHWPRYNRTDEYATIQDAELAEMVLSLEEGDTFSFTMISTPELHPTLEMFTEIVECKIHKVFTCSPFKLVVLASITSNGLTSQPVVVKIRLSWCTCFIIEEHLKEKEMLGKVYPLGLSPNFLADGAILGTEHVFPIIVMEYLPFESVMIQSEDPSQVKFLDFQKVFDGILLIVHSLNAIGLKHTDLAPRNVLFDPEEGKVLLVDMEDVIEMASPLGEEELGEWVSTNWYYYGWY